MVSIYRTELERGLFISKDFDGGDRRSVHAEVSISIHENTYEHFTVDGRGPFVIEGPDTIDGEARVLVDDWNEFIDEDVDLYGVDFSSRSVQLIAMGKIFEVCVTRVSVNAAMSGLGFVDFQFNLMNPIICDFKITKRYSCGS